METMQTPDQWSALDSDAHWTDPLLMAEYERYCGQLRQDQEASLVVMEAEERLSGRIVKNTEWHWLFNYLMRHHTGDIGLDTLTDKQKLDTFLAQQQGKTL